MNTSFFPQGGGGGGLRVNELLLHDRQDTVSTTNFSVSLQDISHSVHVRT